MQNSKNTFEPALPQTEWLTRHGAHRAAQRAVSSEDLLDALEHGRWLHGAGVDFVFLGHRDFPAGSEAAFSDRHLDGLVLVLADGLLVTTYKNRRASRSLRRKPSRRPACGTPRFAPLLGAVAHLDRPLASQEV